MSEPSHISQMRTGCLYLKCKLLENIVLVQATQIVECRLTTLYSSVFHHLYILVKAIEIYFLTILDKLVLCSHDYTK